MKKSLKKTTSRITKFKIYGILQYRFGSSIRNYKRCVVTREFFHIMLNSSTVGADGMLTGSTENVDNIFTTQNRQRQFYLSLDVDLSRIETNSHVLKSLFSLFNTIKVPFPTLEFNDKNGFKLHYIYF